MLGNTFPNRLDIRLHCATSTARKGLTCLPLRTACIAAPAILDRNNGSHRVNSARLAIPGLGLKREAHYVKNSGSHHALERGNG
jgi:hypothetical protein